MNIYNIYKKRDGQHFKLIGEYYEENFNDAKKQFALNCWNDLLQGVHGDNYIERTTDEQGVEENGIYYYNELFFPATNLETGIEYFSEDVYTWMLRNISDI